MALKPSRPQNMSQTDYDLFIKAATGNAKDLGGHRKAHKDFIQRTGLRKPEGVDDDTFEAFLVDLDHKSMTLKGSQDGADHGNWGDDPTLQPQGVIVVDRPVDRIVEKISLPDGVTEAQVATAQALSRLPQVKQEQIMKAAAAADK